MAGNPEADDLWQRVENVFHAMLEQPPERRPKFLDDACAGDTELRREVESLLRASREGESLMEWPAAAQLGLSTAPGVATPSWAPGAVVGPYKIVEKLGTGGMGEVHRAQDLRLGRFVALKVLFGHSGMAGDMRKRVRDEARLIARLNHPHICTLYDLVCVEETEYLVMEYVEGQTLAKVLAGGPLLLQLALEYARDIADALAAAHASGVLHRDLKPANLMVTPAGSIKVLDFGIAKRLHAASASDTQTFGMTGAYTIAGTPRYMAPEVLRGEPADVPSDIWSFGATLREMLTGRPLVEGRTHSEIIAAILERRFAKFLPCESKQVCGLIDRCLEEKPQNRFSGAKELLAALQHLLGRERSRTRLSRLSATPGERTARRTVGELKPCLSTGAPASILPEANEYFEKGILFIWDRPDLPRAREMLRKALALDDHFSEAHAAYAFTDWLMIEQGYSADTSWSYEAEARLYDALQANPNSGLAHYALSAVYLSQGSKDFVPAEVERALRSRPGRPTAIHWLAHYHHLNENYEAATQVWKDLLQRYPLFWPARVNLAEVLLETGEAERALREHEKFLEQAPENVFAIRGLARAYIHLNEVERAADVLAAVRPEDRDNYHIRMSRALIAALTRREDEAQQSIDEILPFAAANALRTFEGAELYAVLGHGSKALEWLHRAIRNGDERASWFRHDPLLASLREDARFQRILMSVEQRRAQSGHPLRKSKRRTGGQ